MPVIDPRTCHHGGLLDFCPYCSPQRYWPVNQQPVTIAPGWACRCGRVFNPEVRECPHCPGQKPASDGNPWTYENVPYWDDRDVVPIQDTPEPGTGAAVASSVAAASCPCQPGAEGGLCGCGEDGDVPAGPCTSFRCGC